MARPDPLLEEVLVATAASTVIATAAAVLYWLVTGFSPWPGLVLGEVAGFGMGIVLLALGTPKRSR